MTLDGLRAGLQLKAQARQIRKQVSQTSRPFVQPGNVPELYTDWLTSVGVTLHRGQRVLCQISFDRLQPDQIDPADESLYAELFGDSQYFPPEAQGTVAWLKGARMGGSYLCALRLLHLALITPLNLAPGEEAFAVMVAPDKKTAAQPYRFITGLIEETPHLRALIVGELGRENFVLQRPDGSRIRFEVLAASAGGSSLRGRSYVGVLLDESSFFRDSDSGVINDLELYRAVAPRIVTGGQLMIISTAWARTGLLWELIEKNLGHPVTCIAAEAHTLTCRPTEANKRIYAEMCDSDPDNAEREFNCVGLAIGTQDFFDRDSIDQCIDQSLPVVSLPVGLISSFAGLDTGFKRDPTGLVIVRNLAGKLLVAESFNRPAEKEGASPRIVLNEMRGRLEAHKCRSLACDQHYVQTVRDELPGYGIRECPPTNEFKVGSHVHLRDLLRSRNVRLPASHKKLIAQMRDLKAAPLAGGRLKLMSSRYSGSHGDLLSALVLAAWIANPGASVDWAAHERLKAELPSWRF